jgi:hypothetical protein
MKWEKVYEGREIKWRSHKWEVYVPILEDKNTRTVQRVNKPMRDRSQVHELPGEQPRRGLDGGSGAVTAMNGYNQCSSYHPEAASKRLGLNGAYESI